MRRPLVLAAVLLAIAAAAPAANAVTPVTPRLTVTPSTVALGSPTVIAGRGWPVIEFCQRTVRLSLRSAQNIVPLAVIRVRDNGRFRYRWTPAPRRIGPGHWRVVARQRCESGKDGSTIWHRKAVPVTLTP